MTELQLPAIITSATASLITLSRAAIDQLAIQVDAGAIALLGGSERTLRGKPLAVQLPTNKAVAKFALKASLLFGGIGEILENGYFIYTGKETVAEGILDGGLDTLIVGISGTVGSTLASLLFLNARISRPNLMIATGAILSAAFTFGLTSLKDRAIS